MQVLTKDEILLHKKKYARQVKEGAVFLHPTDTIYGLGCSVLDEDAVMRIRNMKQRSFMPFSIFVPSKKWIYENCRVSEQAKEWVERLPGPYTLILTLKSKHAVVPEVNNNLLTIGVRIPHHWFGEFVTELGIPIVTTSANVRGQDFMTSLEGLDPGIKAHLDFLVYEGEKKGKPSTIVNLTKEEPEILTR